VQVGGVGKQQVVGEHVAPQAIVSRPVLYAVFVGHVNVLHFLWQHFAVEQLVVDVPPHEMDAYVGLL
jgi:hypothetical protein